MTIQRVPPHFATALRTGRLIRGLTQRQVAAGSGVPTWRLSAFERGVDVPEPEEFTAVWNFLSTGDDAPGAGAAR